MMIAIDITLYFTTIIAILCETAVADIIITIIILNSASLTPSFIVVLTIDFHIYNDESYLP